MRKLAVFTYFSFFKYIEWRFGKMVKTLVAFTSVFNLVSLNPKVKSKGLVGIL